MTLYIVSHGWKPKALLKVQLLNEGVHWLWNSIMQLAETHLEPLQTSMMEILKSLIIFTKMLNHLCLTGL